MHRRVLLDGEPSAASENRPRPGVAQDLEHPLAEHHGRVRSEEVRDHQGHFQYDQRKSWFVFLFVQGNTPCYKESVEFAEREGHLFHVHLLHAVVTLVHHRKVLQQPIDRFYESLRNHAVTRLLLNRF